MKLEHLIGVDIGTQGVKAALYSALGERLSQAFEKSKLLGRDRGVVEEEPEFQVASVCKVVKQCVADAQVAASSVAGIAIDGQMAGVIGIGADGRNVTPYDSWLDTRCAPFIKQMLAEAGDEIVRKAGGPPSFNHGPKILWWKKERPEIYSKTTAFVQPGAYAAMRLCELPETSAFIDGTYLHFSGFADNRKLGWDKGLCKAFGVDVSKLPRIVSPQEIVGRLSAKMAKKCGLIAGTPVVAGCGDTAASFLSCGATKPGICVDVAGTASVFASTTADYTPDVKEKILAWGRAVAPGLWHPYAYINGGGMNMQWFAQLLGAKKSAPTLDELETLAAKVEPRLDDPLFLPHLGGRVNPSCPELRGAFAGLSLNHGEGELYRAVLEAVALEYALYKRELSKLDPQLRLVEMRVTGGGERNTTWNRIKANALGLQVARIEDAGGAPLGSALLAGYGVGLFKNLGAAAEKWVKTGRDVKPDTRLKNHYAARLRRYESLLNALSGFHKGEQ